MVDVRQTLEAVDIEDTGWENPESSGPLWLVPEVPLRQRTGSWRVFIGSDRCGPWEVPNSLEELRPPQGWA